VTIRPRRPLANCWLFLPAVANPVAGGMIKLGRGSTLAAVTVGLAPYAVFGFLLAVFAIGYLAAVARYLCSGPPQQEAMERLIVITASTVVSILTLTAPAANPPTREAGLPRKRGEG
jgi:hypothetical protein